MTTAVDWKDLQTKGFVVVRSFLPEEMVEAMRKVYERAQRNETIYYSMVAQPSDVKPVADRLASLLPEIRAATDIKTDEVQEDGFFFPTEYTKLGWHTDHKSYYYLQEHYHYLNFWIPITKPRRDKSGLGLVPMDALERAAPDAFRAVVRRGAAAAQDDQLHYEGDGKVESLPLRTGLVDEIGIAPDVAPGDLIVARTDLLHKTQDSETVRVALTLRGLWSQQPLSRWVFLRGSHIKHQRMLAEPTAFTSLLASFWTTGKSRITVAEHREYAARAERGEWKPAFYAWAARRLFPLVLLPYRIRSMKRLCGSYLKGLVLLVKIDRAYRRAAQEMRAKGAGGAPATAG